MGRIIVIAVVVFGWSGSMDNVGAFQCNECHSKNPAMVRMHNALQGRGCFDCHKIGEKLMGKGQPKDHNSLMKRRVTDPLCIECHTVKSTSATTK